MYFNDAIRDDDMERLHLGYAIYLGNDLFLNQALMEGFSYASELGNLRIMKQIVAWKPDVDQSFDIEHGFRHACANGHLECAKQIIDWRKEKREYLDQSIGGEFAFRAACRNGHLEMVKKLVEWREQDLKDYPDKTFPLDTSSSFDHIEWAFEWASRNKHDNIINYLVELFPNKLIGLLLHSYWFNSTKKVKIIRPYMARLKIKYFLLTCLYNPNLKWGKRYTGRLLMEDNPLVSNDGSDFGV